MERSRATKPPHFTFAWVARRASHMYNDQDGAVLTAVLSRRGSSEWGASAVPLMHSLAPRASTSGHLRYTIRRPRLLLSLADVNVHHPFLNGSLTTFVPQ